MSLVHTEQRNQQCRQPSLPHVVLVHQVVITQADQHPQQALQAAAAGHTPACAGQSLLSSALGLCRAGRPCGTTRAESAAASTNRLANATTVCSNAAMKMCRAAPKQHALAACAPLQSSVVPGPHPATRKPLPWAVPPGAAYLHQGQVRHGCRVGERRQQRVDDPSTMQHIPVHCRTHRQSHQQHKEGLRPARGAIAVPTMKCATTACLLLELPFHQLQGLAPRAAIY